MRKRTRTGEGRVCRELKSFLEKSGWVVEAIYPTLGSWRRDEYDVMRWEALMRREDETCTRTHGCWETMTEFLKYAKKFGFTISDGSRTCSGYPELWAKGGNHADNLL